MSRVSAALAICALGAAVFVACAEDDTAGVKLLSKEELMKPETCATCHADHVREWSGSMHAYAAEDPIFLAMNRRLQRETNGALGDFCVKCHAPIAVALGKTKDGLNLAELPAETKGVNCYFCHNVASVEGTHNNPLVLAMDQTMRGGISDPAAGSPHRSLYSPLHDRAQLPSSTLCGACHDIVTPAGAHIERTFAEWKASVFNQPKGATCAQCHMRGSDAQVPIATVPDNPNMPVRTKHAHTFAGVDVALTPFPEAEAQRAEVQAFLDKTLQTALCVSVFPRVELRVILDNVGAGHSFPSGSAPDRRAWTEIVATKGDAPVFTSGRFAPGEPVLASAADPALWLLRDRVYDASKSETHEFGLAASCTSTLLPALVTFDKLDPRYYSANIVQRFPRDGSLAVLPDRVELRVHMTPVGLEVVNELVASGDLDPAIVARLPVYDIGKPLVWTFDTAKLSYTEDSGTEFRCVTATNVNIQAQKTPASENVPCPAPPSN